MVGVFSFLSWRYATQNHRLVEPDLDEDLIADIKYESLIEPTAAFIAILAIWFCDAGVGGADLPALADSLCGSEEVSRQKGLNGLILSGLQ